MKKFFLTIIFYLFFLTSNSVAFIEFKQSKNISSDTEQARGINFKPDGTIMYITNRKAASGAEGQKGQVTQYSLSTPFDISTAKKTSQTDLLGSNEATVLKYPHAIEFKPDGTKMFVTAGDAVAAVYQYNLTTAWDSSSAEFEARYVEGRTDVKHLRTLAFKPDGTRMFVGGKDDPATTGKIKQFTLTNPWDLSSGVSAAGLSADIGGSEPNLRNAQFDDTGKILYVGGNDNDQIHKYTLSTAWDILTLSTSFTSFQLVSGFSQMRGFIFVAGFTRLYVVDDTATTSTILEYSPSCTVITCSDPSNDGDVKAIIEANVELSKLVIQHITLPIFHRMEWLRRHKNNENLSNLNAEVDFKNEEISKLFSAFKNSKNEVHRSYNSDDWFKWSEGRVSLGKTKSGNSSSRKFNSKGISFGADKIKKDERDTIHGFVFQYGVDDVKIGNRGTKLETDTYSLALYNTKLSDNGIFRDALIGGSLLEIDQERVTAYSNTLKGDRSGHQIFGSLNFGKRLSDEKINLNPSIKLDLGYTTLKSLNEKTLLGNTFEDALGFKVQNIASALTTIGVILNTTNKREDENFNHYVRLDYIADLSQSSDADFYYLNDQSTIYNYEVDDKSMHNFKIGYGFDLSLTSGWSLVGNFERFKAIGKGYSNEIYFSAGYVPNDKMELVFNLNNFEDTSLSLNKKINEFDLKISSNYKFLKNTPDHGVKIDFSRRF